MAEQYGIRIPNLTWQLKALPSSCTGATRGTLGVNNRFLTKDGKPWLPVMGEFHYSRYPEQYWEESLRKMHAGGIRIVASYIFWIHHEEEKGKWNFSGQRDLRRFVTLCSQLDLLFFLRIGPWVHGECRHGGFPDWLQYDSAIKNRSDDPKYLDLVRILFGKIYSCLKGLLWKDGGPVIGLQIENEYGHVGGIRGPEGLAHMATLKRLALESGFDVPFYTATGGPESNVVDGEMLPVGGAYADAPWAQHTNQLPASRNFLLSPYRNDPLFDTNDGPPPQSFTYKVNEYPYLSAELGGGIQVTTHRRPIITADDTSAQALCRLASGLNLLGYYMYHGGTNPEGALTTLHESTITGSYTDVPVLTYDFQACIGEYGELHQSYRKLKRLHLFLNNFGDLVAPAVSIFPENRVKDSEDLSTLRICVRHNKEDNSGFLFINNHQRNRKMASHKDVNISVELPGEKIHFPPMDIPEDFYGVFPYNISLGGSLLRSTNAQLMCKLGDAFVFSCHEKPVFNFSGTTAPTIVLTEEEAENAWLFGDKLYVTKGDLIEKEGALCLTTCKTQEKIIRYPDKKEAVVNFSPVPLKGNFRETYRDDAYCGYELGFDSIGAAKESINDVFLIINFTGDRAELYRDGTLVADWFTTGLPWRVGLRRFNYEGQYTLKVYPVVKDTYFECEPPKGHVLNNISLEAQYTAKIGSENFK